MNVYKEQCLVIVGLQELKSDSCLHTGPLPRGQSISLALGMLL